MTHCVQACEILYGNRNLFYKLGKKQTRAQYVTGRYCLKKRQVNDRYPCQQIKPLTLNDPYWGRTAPLTSKRCILHIYSTNRGTEYFKHGVYSVFSLQNAVSFIILTYLVPVLFIFYIQCVLKLKK